MVDFATFREDHPHLCNPEQVRVPGLEVKPPPEGTPITDWEGGYEAILREDPWTEPPIARPMMEAHGAEAFGTYLSFRLEPERWGIYLYGLPLVGLAKEVLRVLNLGFVGLQEDVGDEVARRLAFRMAFDVAVNHLAFHAAVDGFAAEREVKDETAYYGAYQAGPYADALADWEGASEDSSEEALANIVALRSYFNPNIAVELGSLAHEALDEEGQFRWNAYLMSGSLTSELTYVLRAYPSGTRRYTEFFRRRGEVGPYAHMAIQYQLDTEAFNEALLQLVGSILQTAPFDGAEKEIVKPVPAKQYVVAGSEG